jgi:hypothetical protein
MHAISKLYARLMGSRQIRRARLTLRLSCDRQARTTARAARQLWWSADLSLARIHFLRSLVLDRLEDTARNEFIRSLEAKSRREFYQQLKAMPSWGSGSMPSSPPV